MKHSHRIRSTLARCPALSPWAGALALVLSTSAVAHGAPSGTLAEVLQGGAKADYDAGRILYSDGDFAGAALKFRAAYDASKDARLLWNMAAARKGQRRYAEVERLVQQYLAEATPLSADDRANAERLLDTIRAFIADLDVEASPEGAVVSIDDVEVGTTPLPRPLRVDIGARVVVVQKPGYEPYRQALEITGDKTLSVTLVPEQHQGRLRIVSPAAARVTVDGKRVTSGSWQGTLPSGPHSVEVTARGKAPYRVDTLVQDGQDTTLQVTLQDASQAGASGANERSGGAMWWWIGGVALALAAGAAVGGYFLLKPEDKGPPPPVEGTLDTVELGLRF